MFKIFISWLKGLKSRNLITIICIFFTLIFLLILPIVSSVLPFTYLAL
jgi:membrane-anchored glycerophosphoryl diester phosphodiesterase (GDPDase)